ncbi:MAG: hypothetical protein DRJ67_03045 [Thermoprotei archaeon]|nr:MAG: hypothetical protein DRJ67_03045 [Thermoprotei archaeon]
MPNLLNLLLSLKKILNKLFNCCLSIKILIGTVDFLNKIYRLDEVYAFTFLMLDTASPSFKYLLCTLSTRIRSI